MFHNNITVFSVFFQLNKCSIGEHKWRLLKTQTKNQVIIINNKINNNKSISHNVLIIQVCLWHQKRLECVMKRTRLECVMKRKRLECVMKRKRLECVMKRTRLECVMKRMTMASHAPQNPSVPSYLERGETRQSSSIKSQRPRGMTPAHLLGLSKKNFHFEYSLNLKYKSTFECKNIAFEC